jgi:integrase
MAMKLTNESIARLRKEGVNEGKASREITDMIEKGLKLVLYASGTASFVMRWVYKKRKYNKTIGCVDIISLSQSRERVKAIKASLVLGNGIAGNDAISYEQIMSKLFVELAEAYMQFSVNRKKSSRSDLGRFKKWILPKFARCKLLNMNTDDIAQFHIEVAELSSTATANRVLNLIKATFTWGIRFGHVVGKSPAANISAFAEPRQAIRYLEQHDVSRLLQRLEQDDKPASLLLRLLAYSGLRMGEALGAKQSDFNPDKCSLYLFDTKSGESRLVQLSNMACDILITQRKLYGSKAWLFPGISGVKPMSPPSRYFRRIATELGFSEDITPHSCRHALAVNMGLCGASIHEISDYLGHKSLKTTQIYLQNLPSKLKQRADDVAAFYHADVIDDAVTTNL